MEKTLKKVCDLVIEDHHKNKDGIMRFEYNAWNNEWYYFYNSYVFGSFEGCENTFEKAKAKAKEKLNVFLNTQ